VRHFLTMYHSLCTINRHIIRSRAQKRLNAIWQRFGGAQTRDDVRKLVEEDNEIAWKVAIVNTADIDAEDEQQVSIVFVN
jgi:hypothetical protein